MSRQRQLPSPARARSRQLPSAVFRHRRLGTSCGGDRDVTAGFDRSAESDCSLTEAPVHTHGRPRPVEAKVPGHPCVCAKADACGVRYGKKWKRRIENSTFPVPAGSRAWTRHHCPGNIQSITLNTAAELMEENHCEKISFYDGVSRVVVCHTTQ